MRPLFPRAGAVLLGALTLSAPTAVPAVAQQVAPPAAPAAAPAATAPVATAAAAPRPARARTTIKVLGGRLNVRAGRTARVRGRLLPRRAGRVVTLERRTRRGWATIDRGRTSASGRYALEHRMRAAGTITVRLRVRGDRTARPAVRHVGRLNAFRPAFASWYGPGLYGNALGCGGTLTPGTVGVAHKSLPCGTPIVLRNGSRIVRTRVIDRGPYVGGREFDLTAATKLRLGFGSTGTIGVAH